MTRPMRSATLTFRTLIPHNSPPDPAGKAQTLAGDLPREFEHSRERAIAHFFGTSDPAQIDDARCRFCYAPGHRHELHVAHDGRGAAPSAPERPGGLDRYLLVE